MLFDGNYTDFGTIASACTFASHKNMFILFTNCDITGISLNLTANK